MKTAGSRHAGRRVRGHRTARIAALACLLTGTLITPGLPAAQSVVAGDCQIRLLGPEDEGELPNKYAGKVAKTFATHVRAITEALALMPPLTCAAVKRAVYVRGVAGHANEEGWVDPDDPDLVNINLDVADPLRRAGDDFGAYYFVKTMQAFLHEATHAADFLLHAHGAKANALGGIAGSEFYKKRLTTHTPEPEDWPATSQQIARELVAKNRLGGSLRAEWSRIQNAFQAYSLGGAYRGPGTDDADYGQLVRDGFTSRYAATSVGEDIAEFAAWMIAAPLMVRNWDGKTMPAKAVDDHACRAMQAHGKAAVPGHLALLYTKANLLLSTGLITQEAFDRCVGKLQLRGPGQGVFVYAFIGDPAEDNVQLRRNFNDDVVFSIGTHPQLGQYVFQLQAGGKADYDGKEYPATVNLRVAMLPAERALETVSWPRGLYDLNALGNRFSVEMPNAPAGTFVSTKGLVLVGYATGERIEGSILLQQAIRPHAPIPVPQTGLPLRFTFSLQK